MEFATYERYLDIALTEDHNIKTSKIMEKLSGNERDGKYGSEVIPMTSHFTNAVVQSIEAAAQIKVDGTGRAPDVCVIDVEGPSDDAAMEPFRIALRKLSAKVENRNFMRVLVVPMKHDHSSCDFPVEELRTVRLHKYAADMVCAAIPIGCEQHSWFPQVICRWKPNTNRHHQSLPYTSSCFRLERHFSVGASNITSVPDDIDTISLPVILNGQGAWSVYNGSKAGLG
jgi:hypothetical protein